MKYILLILMGIFISPLHSKAQQDELISSSNGASMMVCASKKIYAWGSNTVSVGSSNYGGALSTGALGTTILTPTLVTGSPMFNAMSFNQVSAGLGGHFVALGCDSTVWAWGNNYNGQIGNGTSGNFVSSPVQVKAGILAGSSFDNGSGYLKGVKAIYAAAASTFAILSDGRVVSWGANGAGLNPPYDDTYGILGNGTQVEQHTPVFVLNGTSSSPLQSVISVKSTLNVAYALVDVEGDGKGTVYSWGNGINGSLGRNTNGATGSLNTNTYSTSGANTISLSAFPVSANVGFTTLDNIVALSAGDGFALALDTMGYVWAWGNGAWGGTTGQGNLIIHIDPRRVLAGVAKNKGKNKINPYLKAKSIAAGQGFAMAVTLDGKPVSWGNNSGCTGGYLGNGIDVNNTGYSTPVYIVTNSSKVDSNVVAVYRGETWGFYLTRDNVIKTWGCNQYGQLGNGSGNLTKAILFSNPIGCQMKDLRPRLKLNLGDTTVCASTFPLKPIKVTVIPDISSSFYSNYQIKWYKNEVLLPSSPLVSDATLGYSISSPGTYKAVLHYVGQLGDCGGYQDATAEVTVSTFSPSFAVPSNLVYADSLHPHVVATNSMNPQFEWFSDAISQIALDTTTGSAPASIAKTAPGIIVAPDKKITLYVEEKARFSGTVFKKTQSCDPKFGTYDILNNNSSSTPFAQSQFTVYQPITLTELKLMVKFSISSPIGTLSGTLHFGVYGPKMDQNGFLVPDESQLLDSFNVNIASVKSNSSPMDILQEITIPVNIPLPGFNEGYVFYLSPKRKALTNLVGQGYISIGRATCSQTTPIYDDTAEKAIGFTGSTQLFLNASNPSTGGNFYDLKFIGPQGYCDRQPITLVATPVTELSETSSSAISHFTLFPNPAQGILHVNSSESGTLRIFNIQGSEVMTKNLEAGSSTLQMGSLPKSTYIVEFRTYTTVEKAKLILE